MDAQRSAAIIAQIDGLAVPRGQLALWSLGQAGFVIKGGATLAYIDPYLSDRVDAAGKSRRRFPPPLDASQIANAQVGPQVAQLAGAAHAAGAYARAFRQLGQAHVIARNQRIARVGAWRKGR